MNSKRMFLLILFTNEINELNNNTEVIPPLSLGGRYTEKNKVAKLFLQGDIKMEKNIDS